MFDTFDDVARRYETTRPVLSKNHSRDADVRPLGDRRKKWRRVEKLDDNTYILWPGMSDGDGIFSGVLHRTAIKGYSREAKFTREEKEAVAPILWRRAKNGTVTVRVRAPEATYAQSHWTMLETYLPRGLKIANKNGDKYVFPTHGRFAGKKFYLARPSVVTPAMANSVYHWVKNMSVLGEKKDTSPLTFRLCKDGTFEPVGATVKKAVKPVTRVNKKEKANWAPKIKEFWNWFEVINPMLPNDFRSTQEMRRDYAAQIKVYSEGRLNVSQFTNAPGLRGQFTREILSDPDHPGRMYLALALRNDLYTPNRSELNPETGRWEIVPPKEKVVKARYNSAMNTLLELNYKAEVPNE